MNIKYLINIVSIIYNISNIKRNIIGILDNNIILLIN